MHKAIFISLFKLLSPVKVYLFANKNSSKSHSSAAKKDLGTKSSFCSLSETTLFATREAPTLFEVAVCVFSLWLLICINCNVIVIVSWTLRIRSTLDSVTKPGFSLGKPTQQPSIISAQVSYLAMYDFNPKSQSIPGSVSEDLSSLAVVALGGESYPQSASPFLARTQTWNIKYKMVVKVVCQDFFEHKNI